MRARDDLPIARACLPTPHLVSGLILGCAAVLGGCESRAERSAFAVWSDDQAELLVVEHREEVRDGLMDTDSLVSSEHRLWRFDVASGSLERWTSWRRGSVSTAHYLRGAGYALLAVAHVDAPDGFLERVPLEGATARIDDVPRATPSPDGALVGAVTLVCDEPVPGTMSCAAGARFFDGATLDELAPSGASAFTISTDPAEAAYVSRVWAPSPRQELLVRVRKVHRDEWLTPTFAVRPGEAPEEVAPLPCDPLEPETSSGRVSADGRTAEVTIDDGDLQVTIVPGATPGWPTRCFP